MGASAAHSEADVSLRQRGGVVDAVAGHRRDAQALLKLSDGLQLVLGQQVATHLGDARLGADGLRRRQVIARQHHRRHAQCLQVGHGLRG